MFWMIVVAISAGGHPAKLMADPPVAFVSEEKCNAAIEYLKQTKTQAPLACVSFNVIGGVPLESY